MVVVIYSFEVRTMVDKKACIMWDPAQHFWRLGKSAAQSSVSHGRREDNFIDRHENTLLSGYQLPQATYILCNPDETQYHVNRSCYYCMCNLSVSNIRRDLSSVC